MVLTQSTMAPLGSQAPDFSLVNPATSQHVTYGDIRGSKITVVLFICNHCPYVVHIRESLISLIADLANENVWFVAINANDPVAYPDDAPDKMKQYDLGCPYLFDETQDVAREYTAVCTPDIFVFDENDELIYRWQFDETRPGTEMSNGDDLRSAIELGLVGEIIDEQKPSSGCNIKWAS